LISAKVLPQAPLGSIQRTPDQLYSWNLGILLLKEGKEKRKRRGENEKKGRRKRESEGKINLLEQKILATVLDAVITEVSTNRRRIFNEESTLL